MNLIFDEHFDNLNNWNFEYSFIRNEELQYYTDKNFELNNGITIIGKNETVRNQHYKLDSRDYLENREFSNYTSTSINTKGKFEFKYGVVEVKAKIPVIQGAWPAIWLMGVDEAWPYCDEIDVMEMYLCENQPAILGNFMYYDNEKCNWSTKSVNLNYFKENDSEWENKFHIWKLYWTSRSMKISLDDEIINEIDISKIQGNHFKKKHYILLNLAIGSNGGIPYDEMFPLKYEIKYVKVYKEGV